MKLYELPMGTLYKVLDSDVKTPPASLDPTNQAYKLGQIDGMYSWSIGQDDGERYYFAAWTEVVLCQANNHEEVHL